MPKTGSKLNCHLGLTQGKDRDSQAELACVTETSKAQGMLCVTEAPLLSPSDHRRRPDCSDRARDFRQLKANKLSLTASVLGRDCSCIWEEEGGC